jgi:hypothetical protein
VLRNDERLFLQVSDVALIEDRVRRGHYEGSSQGVSIPIASIGGDSVRYHVGANKGHYVQGAPTPTAIDRGTVFVTNKHVVFEGANRPRVPARPSRCPTGRSRLRSSTVPVRPARLTSDSTSRSRT